MRRITMPWIRCPFGCYFQLSELDWAFFKGHPTNLGTCPSCHRIEEVILFQEDAKSSAIAAVGHSIELNNNHLVKNNYSQTDIDISIKMRMSKVMGNITWFGYNQDQLISQLYNKVAQMLLGSELTSNFPTPAIWKILASAGLLKNRWAKGESATDKYGIERNEGEKKFFGSLKGVSGEPTGEGRPYYIALNPGCLQQGAAPYYGRSYMVYGDAVKLRCTFTATDSLQLLKQQVTISPADLCSISTITNILPRVSDRQLRYLCS